MLHKFFRRIAPIAALALGVATSGCDNLNMNINGADGVPLSELDMAGAAPTEIVLAGPDTVKITEGANLAITVEGDAAVTGQLRFDLDGETLTVTRAKGSKTKGAATVNVTMPALTSITLAGSGKIIGGTMAGNADVTIAGSGEVATQNIKVDRLDLTIAGSGTYKTNGTAAAMDMTVAGTGSALMGGLKIDKADITIAGSGDAEFASDGTVDAKIMGSGDVTVRGSAKCTINSMGSGTLNCSAGTPATTEAPKAAEPPETPEGPETPTDGN
ncbi:head GIN domain-containing protein [Altererythrobacter aquiaggeris]|uniref:head GIN domain-containing protein n=1 Tax=Aestuarierythrobacter aquiaggeris TaxID=1898396 RepID=UPI00301875DE